jgi:hypothetical protein
MRETLVLKQTPVSVPICPEEILLGLAWNRTRSSAVTDRLLTARAMVFPDILCMLVIQTVRISTEQEVTLQIPSIFYLRLPISK